MRKIVHMMNSSTTALDQIPMMNRSTKVHESLGNKKIKACKKIVMQGGQKNQRTKEEKKTQKCYYYMKWGHISLGHFAT